MTMKILVFLHGTLIMHKNAEGKLREERVRQVENKESSVLDYASYIPVGNAVEKLKFWHKQGAEILYLSSHETAQDVEEDRSVLEKYNFPKGQIFFRQNGESYKDIAEKIIPDILIEDDCESIGGEKEMTITFVKPEIKQKIKSIVIKEFGGIENLPPNLNDLLKYGDKNKKAVEIYDRIAEEYSKNFDSIDSESDLVFLNTFLAHLKPNSYIVDIGCGTGFSAGYFVKRGMRVEGSDLSSSMISIAKRNYPQIPFSVADMRKFSPKEKADGVWAGYSLFHFEQEDFEETIRQVKTYLKPGGILGLVMQEGEGELERDEPFLPGEKIYLHLYTEEQLKTILSQYNFKIFEKKRKTPLHPNEFPYDKLLLIAK